MSEHDWKDSTIPTPSPEVFLAMEKERPHLWYQIPSGHHRNLFDAAWKEVERLRSSNRTLASMCQIQCESEEARWERVLGELDPDDDVGVYVEEAIRRIAEANADVSRLSEDNERLRAELGELRKGGR